MTFNKQKKYIMQTMKRQESKRASKTNLAESRDQEVHYLKFFSWDTKRLDIPMLTQEDLDNAIDIFKNLIDELKAIKRAELRVSMKTAIAQHLIQDASQEFRYRKKKREEL